MTSSYIVAQVPWLVKMSIHVEELEFDDENRSEIEDHNITMMQIQSVLEGSPRFFRNKRGRAGTHQMIGPDSSGIVLTVPIIETPVHGLWRPITAWPSTKAQETKWRQAK